MTPAALRAEAMELIRLAHDKLAQAAALDAAPATEPNWIPTGRAQQIMRVNSESSVYRLIEKHPEIARRAANGRNWQIDEGKLLAILDRGRGENGEASGEYGECLFGESAR